MLRLLATVTFFLLQPLFLPFSPFSPFSTFLSRFCLIINAPCSPSLFLPSSSCSLFLYPFTENASRLFFPIFLRGLFLLSTHYRCVPPPFLGLPSLRIPLLYPDGLADHGVALFYGPRGNLLFRSLLGRATFSPPLYLHRAFVSRVIGPSVLIDSSSYNVLSQVRFTLSHLSECFHSFLPLIVRIYLG